MRAKKVNNLNFEYTNIYIDVLFLRIFKYERIIQTVKCHQIKFILLFSYIQTNKAKF